jgi:uncharacterized repeat protein (TIGR02543 family)
MDLFGELTLSQRGLAHTFSMTTLWKRIQSSAIRPLTFVIVASMMGLLAGSVSAPVANAQNGGNSTYWVDTDDSGNGIAVDTAGNVWLIDAHTGGIEKFTPSGVHSHPGHCSGAGALVSVVADDSGNIYIGGGEEVITKYDSAGNMTCFAGGPGGTYQIAVDKTNLSSRGTVYVDRTWQGIIKKIAPNAGSATTFVTTPTGNIGSMVVDSNGYLYAGATNNGPGGNRIYKYSSAGTLIQSYDVWANSMAADSQGNVYISTLNEVDKISANGTLSILKSNVDSGYQAYVYGLAVDSHGNVYVGTTTSHLQKITPSGILTDMGPTGASPSTLAVSSTGIVYTADFISASISRFIPPVTITFDSNGGSGSQSSYVYTAGSGSFTIPTSSSFTRAGYLFGGWFTASTGGTQVTSSSTPPASDTTFYAHWNPHSISFTAPSAMNVGDSDQALTATSNAGGSYVVTLTSATPSVCSVISRAIHAIGAGSCTIVASQNGDSTLGAAAVVTRSIRITASGSGTPTLANVITFTAPTAMKMGAPNQALSATSSAGSSYSVSFVSATPSVCSVVNGAIHPLAAGLCTITASQNGDSSYVAAALVARSITISAGQQIITFTAPTTMTGTGGTQTLVASSSAGNSYPVSFSTSSSTCSISGTTLTSLSGGSCSITASQAGDTSVGAAASVVRTITIGGLSQTITFNALAAISIPSGTQSLVASSSSGLTVTFTTSSPACSVSGSTLTAVSAGSCVVTASQAGDSTYKEALVTSRSITVMQSQTALVVSNSNASSISKGATGITLDTTGGSGTGAVSFVVSGAGCNFVPSTKVMSVATSYKSGSSVSCTVTATKLSTGTYLSATSVSKVFTFAP